MDNLISFILHYRMDHLHITEVFKNIHRKLRSIIWTLNRKNNFTVILNAFELINKKLELVDWKIQLHFILQLNNDIKLARLF